MKKLGYRADSVGNGIEAIKALEMINYDLVLMDIQMPEMDGFEATKVIRNENSTVLNHNVIIVAMTAHSMKGDRERCLERGMNNYISKPVKANEITEVLDNELSIIKSSGHDSAFSCKKERKDIFDLEGLLERFDGDKKLTIEILQEVLDTNLEYMEKLKKFLEEDKIEAIGFLAHSLKGIYANINAPVLNDIAHNVEITAKEMDIKKISPLVLKLEEEAETLCNIIKECIIELN